MKYRGFDIIHKLNKITAVKGDTPKCNTWRESAKDLAKRNKTHRRLNEEKSHFGVDNNQARTLNRDTSKLFDTHKADLLMGEGKLYMHRPKNAGYAQVVMNHNQYKWAQIIRHVKAKRNNNEQNNKKQ